MEFDGREAVKKKGWTNGRDCSNVFNWNLQTFDMRKDKEVIPLVTENKIIECRD